MRTCCCRVSSCMTRVLLSSCLSLLKQCVTFLKIAIFQSSNDGATERFCRKDHIELHCATQEAVSLSSVATVDHSYTCCGSPAAALGVFGVQLRQKFIGLNTLNLIPMEGKAAIENDLRHQRSLVTSVDSFGWSWNWT